MDADKVDWIDPVIEKEDNVLGKWEHEKRSYKELIGLIKRYICVIKKGLLSPFLIVFIIKIENTCKWNLSRMIFCYTISLSWSNLSNL